ncbi:MAG: DNA recombination/repair protein RecA [Planctomycetes bacterium]|nr:DNA recombination/repair protein RecA [Planctomycetota bacterium]
MRRGAVPRAVTSSPAPASHGNLALRTATPEAVQIAPWSRDALAGRLVEISDPGEGAPLTMAFSLVLDAQRRRETVAWVTSRESVFFPPDVAANGVDLEGLAVIRLPDPSCVARAADRLLRSGAFGLVVLDLGTGDVSMPLQARLLGLAERHDAAVVCLTEKQRSAPSLSSLVSLRVEARRRRVGEGVFSCVVESVKDKRRAPGWTHEEVRHAPPGLR